MVIDSITQLPKGIVSVIQTPFGADGQIDWRSLERLVETTIASRVDGFLAPVVASEVAYLTDLERTELLRFLAKLIDNRVPLIVGASSDEPEVCRQMGRLAIEVNAAAWLVAVPQRLYGKSAEVHSFFHKVSVGIPRPIVIQDLQFNGPGLSIADIRQLRDEVTMLRGIKIETVPSGPKYSAVREALGPDFWIAGGWAVTQLIEALDRRVDAMIPESSMVGVYKEILNRYQSSNRDSALELFRSLLPVLAFTNQELAVSIAFFKRLLVRKGLFEIETLRIPGFRWDQFNERIADELIDYYEAIEGESLKRD